MATFVPLAHRYVAALEGIDDEEFRREPALAASSLAALTRRFGWSLTVSHWEPGFESLAFGGAGEHAGSRRTPDRETFPYVDVVRGLRAALGPSAGVVTTITGPRTLGPRVPLSGGQLDGFYSDLIRVLADAGADHLMICESSEAPPTDSEARRLRSMIRAARYFRLITMVWDLSGDVCAGHEDADHVFGKGTAIMLPPDALLSLPPDTTDLLAGSNLVTTSGQIPVESPADAVATWSERIAGAGRPAPTVGG